MGLLDKTKLAKEVMDVLRCALQVAIYDGIQELTPLPYSIGV